MKLKTANLLLLLIFASLFSLLVSASTQITEPAANEMAILTGSGERIRIDSSGNVGIGTSIPSSELEIFDSTGSSILTVESGSGASNAYLATNNSDQIFYFGTAGDTSDVFKIRDGTVGADRFFIDTAGNIGIGVTPATYPDGSTFKHVFIGGQGNVFAHTAAGSGGGTYIGHNLLHNGSGWQYIASTDEGSLLYLQNGGLNFINAPSGSGGAVATTTTRFTITEDGDVGIGTSAPASTLDIVGNVNISGQYLGDGSQITGVVASSTSWNISGNLVYLANTDDQVGIGTNTPYNALHIANDTAGLQIGSQDTGVDARPLQVFGDFDTNTTFYIRNTHDGARTDFFFYANNKSSSLKTMSMGFDPDLNALHFDNSQAADVMIIQNTGEVGIGTTDVDSALSVAGSIGTGSPNNVGVHMGTGLSTTTAQLQLTGTHGTIPALIDFANTTGTDADFRIVEVNSDLFEIRSRTTGSGLAMDSAGWLGVNTTSPLTYFHVRGTEPTYYGQLYLEGIDALAADAGSAISFGGVYTGSSTTNFAAVKGLKETVTDGQYGAYLGFFTRTHGEGDVAERMRIDSTGLVGIGVTDPDQELEVDGQIKSGTDFSGSTADIGLSTGNWHLQLGDSSGRSSKFTSVYEDSVPDATTTTLVDLEVNGVNHWVFTSGNDASGDYCNAVYLVFGTPGSCSSTEIAKVTDDTCTFSTSYSSNSCAFRINFDNSANQATNFVTTVITNGRR